MLFNPETTELWPEIESIRKGQLHRLSWHSFMKVINFKIHTETEIQNVTKLEDMNLFKDCSYCCHDQRRLRTSYLMSTNCSCKFCK